MKIYKTEIQNRIADCTATANRLKFFWNKADNSIKWKLQVYDAVIRSKLLYGLECIQLTQVEQDRIDAFQMKGIRRIMKVPPTYEDRTQTNEVVMQEAKKIAEKDIFKFSDMWLRQKLKLLGHLLRASPDDPLHQVIFHENTKKPRLYPIARVGRPREKWLFATLEDAFNILAQNPYLEFDHGNQEHMEWLIETANNRAGIFATNNKTNTNEMFGINYVNNDLPLNHPNLSVDWTTSRHPSRPLASSLPASPCPPPPVST